MTETFDPEATVEQPSTPPPYDHRTIPDFVLPKMVAVVATGVDPVTAAYLTVLSTPVLEQQGITPTEVFWTWYASVGGDYVD